MNTELKLKLDKCSAYQGGWNHLYWQRRLITDMVEFSVHSYIKQTKTTFSWFCYCLISL